MLKIYFKYTNFSYFYNNYYNSYFNISAYLFFDSIYFNNYYKNFETKTFFSYFLDYNNAVLKKSIFELYNANKSELLKCLYNKSFFKYIYPFYSLKNFNFSYLSFLKDYFNNKNNFYIPPFYNIDKNNIFKNKKDYINHIFNSFLKNWFNNFYNFKNIKHNLRFDFNKAYKLNSYYNDFFNNCFFKYQNNLQTKVKNISKFVHSNAYVKSEKMPEKTKDINKNIYKQFNLIKDHNEKSLNQELDIEVIFEKLKYLIFEELNSSSYGLY